MLRSRPLQCWLAGLALALSNSGVAETASDDWSFDLALRERATLLTAIEYDANDPAEGAFFTQRITLTAAGPVTERVSATLSLVSALQEGSEPSPIERNNLDIQQGFFDVRFDDLTLRVGRQELWLGSQRLVATRDGTNVRRTFDGVRAFGQVGDWRWDAFGMNLVEVEPNGVFNDSRDSGRELAGVYVTGPVRGTSLDLYYLYAGFDVRTEVIGTADQRRHSLGFRAFGSRNAWYWNWEGIYQFGDHGDADIDAWTLATNTGRKFAGAWSPEVMLSINVASGDSDPNDNTLGTFNALYPRGDYFSAAAILGPANFYNVHPYLRLAPSESLSLQFDVNLFWRLETEDGVYGPPGNLIRAPGGSNARFVSSAASLSAAWAPRERLAFGMSLTHNRPERFLQETGPADIINFVEFTFDLRF
ncbi:MAG: alginate export family protein [Pseudomonadota bacterium]